MGFHLDAGVAHKHAAYEHVVRGCHCEQLMDMQCEALASPGQRQREESNQATLKGRTTLVGTVGACSARMSLRAAYEHVVRGFSLARLV